jgi:hypothetical protein
MQDNPHSTNRLFDLEQALKPRHQQSPSTAPQGSLFELEEELQGTHQEQRIRPHKPARRGGLLKRHQEWQNCQTNSLRWGTAFDVEAIEVTDRPDTNGKKNQPISVEARAFDWDEAIALQYSPDSFPTPDSQPASFAPAADLDDPAMPFTVEGFEADAGAIAPPPDPSPSHSASEPLTQPIEPKATTCSEAKPLEAEVHEQAKAFAAEVLNLIKAQVNTTPAPPTTTEPPVPPAPSVPAAAPVTAPPVAAAPVPTAPVSPPASPPALPSTPPQSEALSAPPVPVADAKKAEEAKELVSELLNLIKAHVVPEPKGTAAPAPHAKTQSSEHPFAQATNYDQGTVPVEIPVVRSVPPATPAPVPPHIFDALDQRWNAEAQANAQISQAKETPVSEPAATPAPTTVIPADTHDTSKHHHHTKDASLHPQTITVKAAEVPATTTTSAVAEAKAMMAPDPALVSRFDEFDRLLEQQDHTQSVEYPPEPALDTHPLSSASGSSDHLLSEPLGEETWGNELKYGELATATESVVKSLSEKDGTSWLTKTFRKIMSWDTLQLGSRIGVIYKVNSWLAIPTKLFKDSGLYSEKIVELDQLTANKTLNVGDYRGWKDYKKQLSNSNLVVFFQYPDLFTLIPKDFTDKGLANDIREQVAKGFRGEPLTYKYDDKDNELACLIYLTMFGAETQRCPRWYGICLMILDLISAGELTWKQVFSAREGKESVKYFPPSTLQAVLNATKLNLHSNTIEEENAVISKWLDLVAGKTKNNPTQQQKVLDWTINRNWAIEQIQERFKSTKPMFYKPGVSKPVPSVSDGTNFPALSSKRPVQAPIQSAWGGKTGFSEGKDLSIMNQLDLSESFMFASELFLAKHPVRLSGLGNNISAPDVFIITYQLGGEAIYFAQKPSKHLTISLEEGANKTAPKSLKLVESIVATDIRFLPWQADKVTYCELDSQAGWFFTGPMQGCHIYVGYDSAAHTSYVFHVNANSQDTDIDRNIVAKDNKVIHLVDQMLPNVKITHRLGRDEYRSADKAFEAFFYGHKLHDEWRFYVHCVEFDGKGNASIMLAAKEIMSHI